MDTDSFIIHIFTEHFFKDIAKDVKKWFDTSGYDKNDNRPLPIGINNKVLGMFKDKLNGMIMKKLCAPISKTYAHLLDNNVKKKKAKGTKKCVIKCRIKFDDYTDSLFDNKTILRLQQRLKSDDHTIFTENISKAAITCNDDKRLQTYNKITTYPYGTEVCERERLSLRK